MIDSVVSKLLCLAGGNCGRRSSGGEHGHEEGQRGEHGREEEQTGEMARGSKNNKQDSEVQMIMGQNNVVDSSKKAVHDEKQLNMQTNPTHSFVTAKERKRKFEMKCKIKRSKDMQLFFQEFQGTVK